MMALSCPQNWFCRGSGYETSNQKLLEIPQNTTASALYTCTNKVYSVNVVSVGVSKPSNLFFCKIFSKFCRLTD